MSRSQAEGERFQEGTRYRRGAILRGERTLRRPPPGVKKYPGAKTAPMPPPKTRGGLPLWEAIAARRSERVYADKAIARSELSQLLWATQGVTLREGGFGYRAAPSAGALYPIETYVVCHDVEDLAAGVYHYGVDKHQLSLLKEGDFRAAVEAAALEQDSVRHAGTVFIWSAVFDRCKWKYGQRAYRYVYLDVAHIAQNLALAAVALGLASCPIGAFFDDEMNAIVDIDGDRESVLHVTSVGRKG